MTATEQAVLFWDKRRLAALTPGTPNTSGPHVATGTLSPEGYIVTTPR